MNLDNIDISKLPADVRKKFKQLHCGEQHSTTITMLQVVRTLLLVLQC